MAENTRTLADLAELVRSKNAGPFWITLDVFFASTANYDQVEASGVLTRDTIGELYRVDPAVVQLYHLPSIRVMKASFPRPAIQGSLADRDIHAGQQHIPLADLTVPESDTGHPRSHSNAPISSLSSAPAPASNADTSPNAPRSSQLERPQPPPAG